LTYVDRFQIPLALALFMIVVESLVSDTRPIGRKPWTVMLFERIARR
jgi:hypothetical protein